MDPLLRQTPPLEKMGELRILAIPSAKVEIDGRLEGYTPRIKNKIAAGTHMIRLIPVSGGAPIRQSIVVKPDQRTVVIVKMETGKVTMRFE